MKILIDISNIVPGVGGSGGGIAVYANNLLKEIDDLAIHSPDTIVCIINKKNNTHAFKNIEIIETSINLNSLFYRFIWVNFYLPFFCVKNKISVLHRVVPELPFIKVCNYVCTLHDLMYRFHLKNDKQKEIKLKHKLKAIGYGLILKRSLANARHILVPSFSIKKEVVEVLRINPGKIEVTHEGIQNIEVRKPVLNGRDIFRILVVAGFYPHKGHAKVVELASVLISKGIKNFTITFQGNPFYLSILTSIKEAIKKHQLEKHIFIHDFKKEHNVEKMYASYDCFLLFSEYEGFGLPVLEAQISGLPVICSEIEVFKEVLLDSAVFVNTHDIQNSCNKVIELMHDKEARNALIEKGFNNCKRFSWSKMARETMLAYSKC